MKKWLQWGMGVILWCTACNSGQKTKEMPADEWRKEAVDTLRAVMHKQQQWVKVHAAEFLVWTGHPEGVKEVYSKELELFGDQPQYRIGIRRVLAQLSSGREQKDHEMRILHAFLDTAGKDRIHAAETLGKLKISPYASHPAETRAALDDGTPALRAYANWAVAYTGDSAMANAQAYFLHNIANPEADIMLRKIAAYVLRYIGGTDEAAWNRLADEVLDMPEDADGRLNFLTTAVILAEAGDTKTEKYQRLHNELLANATTGSKAVRIEIANALVAKGTGADLPLLQQWLRNELPVGVVADDADVQASAAYAILKICERAPVNN